MWALGAGGAVDAGEDPARALARELEEEWGVEPERLAVEALIATPSDMTMLIGQAWLAPGAEVTRDHEHDAHAWWPPDPARVARRGTSATPAPGHVVGRRHRELPHAQVPVVHALGDLHGPAGRSRSRARLDGAKYVLGWAHGIGWIVMSLLCIDAVRRARDPALARRDGRGRRRRRPVRGQRRVPVCRAACKFRRTLPSTRYGLGP